MKKTIFIFVFISLIVNVYAQKSNVNTASGLLYAEGQPDLAKAKKLIDAACTNDETKNWSKTYSTKGKVYLEIAKSPLPAHQELSPDAALIAYEAFMKALELGTKEMDVEYAAYKEKCESKGKPVKKERSHSKFDYKEEKEIKNKLGDVQIFLRQKGAQYFSNSDYKGAFKAFEYAVIVDELNGKLVAGNDTMIPVFVYNTALAAYQADLHKETAKYAKLAIDLNYGVKNDNNEQAIVAYQLAANAYTELEQYDKAVEIQKQGIEKFPNNNEALIKGLVNYYLKNEKYDEALKYLEAALKNDPNNATLYFVKGTLKEKAGKVEDARAAYNKAIEIKPDYGDAYYNLGVLKYNDAAAVIVAANEIPSNEEERYDKEVAKANKIFEEALPLFLKAHELNPDDPYPIRSLKEIYFKLNKTEKSNEMKAKLEALEN